jgi:mono/diheme cytochrome c family protein
MVGVFSTWRARAARESVAAAAAAVLPALLLAPAGRAEESAAAKARAGLSTHCARCHQSELAGAEGAKRFGNILDLEAIARDRGLVTRGRHDASRLYQRMVGRREPGDVYRTAPGPTPEEIEAVRDWIAGLSRDDACEGRPVVSAASASAAMAQWLAAQQDYMARDTRFLSLVALYNACAPASRLAAYRQAVARLMGLVGGRGGDIALEPIGDSNTILALRLRDAGLTPAQWDALTRNGPRAPGGELPAEWLASAVVNNTVLLADAALAAPSPSVPNAELAALAREWDQEVGLDRAAAEAGLERGALAARLSAYAGAEETAARRLLQGPVPRMAWQRLAEAMGLPPGRSPTNDDGSSRAPPAAGSSASAIDLGLWSEKPAYRRGELLSLAVTTSLACHLTLISVDPQGRAVVLFPNDIEPDNVIAPTVTIRIPSASGGYKLRLDREGEETIIAICRRTARRPEGIAFDFEKERFTILGDWRTFLREAGKREADIKRKEARRAKRKRKPEGPPPIDPDGPALEGRAAITIPVEASRSPSADGP